MADESGKQCFLCPCANAIGTNCNLPSCGYRRAGKENMASNQLQTAQTAVFNGVPVQVDNSMTQYINLLQAQKNYLTGSQATSAFKPPTHSEMVRATSLYADETMAKQGNVFSRPNPTCDYFSHGHLSSYERKPFDFYRPPVSMFGNNLLVHQRSNDAQNHSESARFRYPAFHHAAENGVKFQNSVSSRPSLAQCDYTLGGQQFLSERKPFPLMMHPRSNDTPTWSEKVAVPTSEHAAEIIGKQGEKIKALRASTKTYIKSPLRGEDPVFLITGTCEQVQVAKREIQDKARHFTMLRSHSKKSCSLPTVMFPVEKRLVGLVVGTKGKTIQRLQNESQCLIRTPDSNQDPCFSIQGTQANIEIAKKKILDHIATTTRKKTPIMNNQYQRLNSQSHYPRENKFDRVLPNHSASSTRVASPCSSVPSLDSDLARGMDTIPWTFLEKQKPFLPSDCWSRAVGEELTFPWNPIPRPPSATQSNGDEASSCNSCRDTPSPSRFHYCQHRQESIDQCQMSMSELNLTKSMESKRTGSGLFSEHE